MTTCACEAAGSAIAGIDLNIENYELNDVLYLAGGSLPIKSNVPVAE